jgi:hypothetical protein
MLELTWPLCEASLNLGGRPGIADSAFSEEMRVSSGPLGHLTDHTVGSHSDPCKDELLVPLVMTTNSGSSVFQRDRSDKLVYTTSAPNPKRRHRPDSSKGANSLLLHKTSQWQLTCGRPC